MKQIATTWLLVSVLAVLWLSQLQAQPQTGFRTVPASFFAAKKRPARSAGTHRAVRLIAAEEAPKPPIEELDRSSSPSPQKLERRRVEKREKYSELQERLQVLIREWQANNNKLAKQPAEDPATAEPDQGAAEQSTPTPPEESGADETSPTSPTDASPEQSPDAPPVPDTTEPVTSPTEAVTDPTKKTGLKLPDEVLVHGPVGRIALADNLYAMGEFSLAKEMYEQVDMKMQSVDQQFWVQFQNASCLREMGDLAKAKKQLRILAGQAEAEWLATSARWWLDMIDDRAELEQQISATQSQLNSRRKVADASNTK